MEPHELFQSNQSIQNEYDWTAFIYPLGIESYVLNKQKNEEIREFMRGNVSNAALVNTLSNNSLYRILIGNDWKGLISTSNLELYNDILSAGMGGMSVKQKFFDQGLAGFKDFSDFDAKLKNTVNQTNSIEERHTAVPLSEAGSPPAPGLPPAPIRSAKLPPLPLAFSSPGVQGVSLKGHVVEVKRTT